MPRSPSKNQDIRDARRAEILRAATGLFARRGLEGTRIDEIAAAAGLSHGLVYHYFPSKEALFEAILADKREQAWSRIADVGARVGPRAALEALVTGALADAAERPEVTLLLTRALTSEAVPERVRASVRRGAREGFARAVALVEAGQRSGEIDASVPASELAAALFSVLRGIFMSTALVPRARRSIPVPTASTILRLLDARAPSDGARDAEPTARARGGKPGAKRAGVRRAA